MKLVKGCTANDLSSAAKMSIGLGVPLALVTVAFIGFLLYHRRKTRSAAALTVQVHLQGFPVDEDIKMVHQQGNPTSTKSYNTADTEGLPSYAGELEGSLVVKRYELPAGGSLG
jgi:hypothetical protein